MRLFQSNFPVNTCIKKGYVFLPVFIFDNFNIFCLQLLDEINKSNQVLRHHTSPILIRILVIEGSQAVGANHLDKLEVEAQIIEIDGKKVKEIDVTQMVIKLDSAKNELLKERIVTVIRIAKSKIMSCLPKDDIHVHNQGGKIYVLNNIKQRVTHPPCYDIYVVCTSAHISFYIFRSPS
jgi:hypothetical protein